MQKGPGKQSAQWFESLLKAPGRLKREQRKHRAPWAVHPQTCKLLYISVLWLVDKAPEKKKKRHSQFPKWAVFFTTYAP